MVSQGGSQAVGQPSANRAVGSGTANDPIMVLQGGSQAEGQPSASHADSSGAAASTVGRAQAEAPEACRRRGEAVASRGAGASACGAEQTGSQGGPFRAATLAGAEKAGAELHVVREAHGYIVCTVCGAYGRRKTVGLGRACPGRPEKPNAIERKQKQRAANILAGLHPTSRQPLD